MGTVTYPSLEHVAQQARPYPTHVLEGCETGLVLFAAAFLGHNDAIHFAEAGIRTLCVDVDEERLREMEQLYPADWGFHANDAWEFARAVEGYPVADVVSADPFTGDMMARVLSSLELWCSLARKAVVVGITLDLTSAYATPTGWNASLFHRANDVYWLVLEHA
jgi:hypothetical protein